MKDKILDFLITILAIADVIIFIAAIIIIAACIVFG
jgi:hypothetical protein